MADEPVPTEAQQQTSEAETIQVSDKVQALLEMLGWGVMLAWSAAEDQPHTVLVLGVDLAHTKDACQAIGESLDKETLDSGQFAGLIGTKVH